MSNNPIQDASFVVRIWWEQTGQDDFSWRGQVVHARTRQSAYFKDIDSLVTFVERWAGDLAPKELPPAERRVSEM